MILPPFPRFLGEIVEYEYSGLIGMQTLFHFIPECWRFLKCQTFEFQIILFIEVSTCSLAPVDFLIQ